MGLLYFGQFEQLFNNMKTGKINNYINSIHLILILSKMYQLSRTPKGLLSLGK
jgi:hypothetical protein